MSAKQYINHANTIIYDNDNMVGGVYNFSVEKLQDTKLYEYSSTTPYDYVTQDMCNIIISTYDVTQDYFSSKELNITFLFGEIQEKYILCHLNKVSTVIENNRVVKKYYLHGIGVK